MLIPRPSDQRIQPTPKEFLKLVDSLDLRNQTSNWLERLPAGSITTWEDLTTRFLAQFFLLGRTAKLRNDILMFQQHQGESLFEERTIDQSAGGKLRDRNAEESWALLEDLALYDNESWNDPRDFAKPVKAITLPQDVPSTSDHRLIELENQVQHLMEAHLAPMQPTQWKIPNKPLLNMHPRVPTKREVSGLVSNFMASQDARLSKFEADFKQQQSEMTNKIDTLLKAITDRIAGALPSDTVKNPKLSINSTSLVLSTRSYPAVDPQCSSYLLHFNQYKYVESLELGKNGSTFVQREVSAKIEDPGLFTLPYRLGDSKPFNTLADLGSCVNIIPLYSTKILTSRTISEETDPNKTGLLEQKPNPTPLELLKT
ncbi:MAK10-like protein [Tanacetum coccineum]